jgi:hypothetical protein
MTTGHRRNVQRPLSEQVSHALLVMSGLLTVAPAMVLLAGCAGAGTAAERAATQKAWEARDQERAVECARQGAQYFSGSCTRGGR